MLKCVSFSGSVKKGSVETYRRALTAVNKTIKINIRWPYHVVATGCIHGYRSEQRCHISHLIFKVLSVICGKDGEILLHHDYDSLKL